MDNTKTKNMLTSDVLPTDSHAAIKVLIQITERLLDVSDRETQALVRGDNVSFSILQHEKESHTAKYVKASQEFRNRLKEFKGMESNILKRLEILQNQLGEKTKSNSDILARMYRPNNNSQNQSGRGSLLSVQELAQQKPVKVHGINGKPHNGAHTNM